MSGGAKPWARHVRANEARLAGNAQRELRFVQNAARWFSRLRWVLMGMALLHWAVLSVAFGPRWWLLPLTMGAAWCGAWVLPRLPAPLLTGGLWAGVHGLLVSLLSMGVVAGGQAAAAGFGQVMVLVFLGLAAPVIVGMIVGYFVSQWDSDHLTQ